MVTAAPRRSAMGPLLLLLVAAVATLATAPCSSDHAGDAAEDLSLIHI